MQVILILCFLLFFCATNILTLQVFFHSICLYFLHVRNKIDQTQDTSQQHNVGNSNPKTCRQRLLRTCWGAALWGFPDRRRHKVLCRRWCFLIAWGPPAASCLRNLFFSRCRHTDKIRESHTCLLRRVFRQNQVPTVQTQGSSFRLQRVYLLPKKKWCLWMYLRRRSHWLFVILCFWLTSIFMAEAPRVFQYLYKRQKHEKEEFTYGIPFILCVLFNICEGKQLPAQTAKPRRRRGSIRRVSKRWQLTLGARRGCSRGQHFVYQETLFRHRDSGTEGEIVTVFYI